MRSPAFILGFLGLLSSCAVTPEEFVYQAKKEWVVVRNLPAGYPELTPFHHPYSLSAPNLLDILGAVFFRENVVVSLAWGRPQPVFSRRQQELLATALSEALSRAGPYGVAAFAVTDDKVSHRRTSGFCFVAGSDLHLVMEEIGRPDYLGEEKPYQPPQGRWRLDPQTGQRLFAARPGDGDKEKWKNWLIINLD